MPSTASTPRPSTAPLKVAIIVADEREVHGRHELPEPYLGPAPTSLLAGLRQTPGVEVHIVSCVRKPVRVPPRLADNIFFHALLVPRWGFLKTAYLPCVLKIRKKMRELRPDVVHGQGTEAYYALTAALSGFPNLITIHGNMRQVARALKAKMFSYHWFIAHLEAWTLGRTGGVLCLTRYTREQVQPPARKTWLLPNAVDESFFRIESNPDNERTLLCVANVAPYKNQNELMRQLDPIASQQKIRLVFAGGADDRSPYGAEFLQMVKSRPWCAHKGFLTGDALREQFRTAQMLLLPSLEDNCPMVVLEAMACGVPVAASRIGGIPDLIDHEVNGLLFDPRQPGAIRDAVLKLLGDPAAAKALSTAGRRRALERYHPVEIARRHLEIYREVAGRS